MKVNPSALKHGIGEPDILYAAENWAYASDPDEDILPSSLCWVSTGAVVFLNWQS
ncbi:MAG: hypothetical protein WBG89_10200 [Ornithinimicrobium sp.]